MQNNNSSRIASVVNKIAEGFLKGYYTASMYELKQIAKQKTFSDEEKKHLERVFMMPNNGAIEVYFNDLDEMVILTRTPIEQEKHNTHISRISYLIKNGYSNIDTTKEYLDVIKRYLKKENIDITSIIEKGSIALITINNKNYSLISANNVDALNQSIENQELLFSEDKIITAKQIQESFDEGNYTLTIKIINQLKEREAFSQWEISDLTKVYKLANKSAVEIYFKDNKLVYEERTAKEQEFYEIQIERLKSLMYGEVEKLSILSHYYDMAIRFLNANEIEIKSIDQIGVFYELKVIPIIKPVEDDFEIAKKRQQEQEERERQEQLEKEKQAKERRATVREAEVVRKRVNIKDRIKSLSIDTSDLTELPTEPIEVKEEPSEKKTELTKTAEQPKVAEQKQDETKQIEVEQKQDLVKNNTASNIITEEQISGEVKEVETKDKEENSNNTVKTEDEKVNSTELIFDNNEKTSPSEKEPNKAKDNSPNGTMQTTMQKQKHLKKSDLFDYGQIETNLESNDPIIKIIFDDVSGEEVVKESVKEVESLTEQLGILEKEVFNETKENTTETEDDENNIDKLNNEESLTNIISEMGFKEQLEEVLSNQQKTENKEQKTYPTIDLNNEEEFNKAKTDIFWILQFLRVEENIKLEELLNTTSLKNYNIVSPIHALFKGAAEFREDTSTIKNQANDEFYTITQLFRINLVTFNNLGSSAAAKQIVSQLLGPTMSYSQSDKFIDTIENFLRQPKLMHELKNGLTNLKLAVEQELLDIDNNELEDCANEFLTKNKVNILEILKQAKNDDNN